MSATSSDERAPRSPGTPQPSAPVSKAPYSATSSKVTALLTEALVTSGGQTPTRASNDVVRIVLMDVHENSSFDWKLRLDLLEKVARSRKNDVPTVILAPAGYFGHDNLNVQAKRRETLPAAMCPRDLAIRELRKLVAKLPSSLLLLVGIDWHRDDRSSVTGYRGQTLWAFRGGSNTEQCVVRRHESNHSDRMIDFAGLSFFLSICGEHMSSKPNGPMFGGRRSPYFSAAKDIHGHGIDVVVNAAHIRVKRTIDLTTDPRRFPFQVFLRDVSGAGAACFLAHHHPSIWYEKAGRPRDDSYCGWGVYAGGHLGRDWMAGTGAPSETISSLVRHRPHCQACKRALLEALYWIDPAVVDQAPNPYSPAPSLYPASIQAIHRKLLDRAVADSRGPKGSALAVRRMPFDYYLPAHDCFVEFDEDQHFTEARALALSLYPEHVKFGFDRDAWVRRCCELRRVDLQPRYRDEQRAWLDTLRDLAPVVVGHGGGKLYRPTIRLGEQQDRLCERSVTEIMELVCDRLNAAEAG